MDCNITICSPVEHRRGFSENNRITGDRMCGVREYAGSTAKYSTPYNVIAMVNQS
jgi:hypothetical protein